MNLSQIKDFNRYDYIACKGWSEAESLFQLSSNFFYSNRIEWSKNLWLLIYIACLEVNCLRGLTSCPENLLVVL